MTLDFTIGDWREQRDPFQSQRVLASRFRNGGLLSPLELRSLRDYAVMNSNWRLAQECRDALRTTHGEDTE